MLGEATWGWQGRSLPGQDRDDRSLLESAYRCLFFVSTDETQISVDGPEQTQVSQHGDVASGVTEGVYDALGETATAELYWDLLLAETCTGWLYSLRDSEIVRSFVMDHPDLVEVLLEAKPHLVRYFGDDTHVSLRVLRDPEIGEEGELVAYILTPLSVDKAQSRLDDLDDGWFLDQVDRVGDLLNFNLAFV